MKKIDRVIQAIRDSFIGSEHVYKNGSCWHFANILKTIFPEGEIWENFEHCIFHFEGKFYDIEGEVNPRKWSGLEKTNKLPLTEKFDMVEMIKELK